MSVITLHHGQCGNQICEALYSNIYNDICSNSKKSGDYYAETLNTWFHVSKTNKLEARSVLIDTENKVVNNEKARSYSFKNIVMQSRGGCGNNWAFGYVEQSKFLIDEVLNCVRIELEKSDVQTSFMNILSSSGGTGAGVGSFVIECLKNEFPKNIITNAVILPYIDGELITQSYNSLLTLSKIYSISDSLFIFENDRLHYNCVNSLSIKNVTFNDINNLIGQQLLSVYQPLRDLQTVEVLRKLCQNSQFKFLQIRSAPLSKLDCAQNWKSLLTSISRQSRYDFQQRTRYHVNIKSKSHSTAIICRGIYSPIEKDFQTFKDLNLCNSVNFYHHRQKIFNLENCVSVVSNSNNVYIPINAILQDARNLYKYHAYLHHYKKFDIGEAQFENSFEIVENILKNYKNL